MIWTELYPLQNFNVEGLTPEVMVFVDTRFKEEIKNELGHMGGALISRTNVPRRGHTEARTQEDTAS